MLQGYFVTLTSFSFSYPVQFPCVPGLPFFTSTLLNPFLYLSHYNFILDFVLDGPEMTIFICKLIY